MRGKYNETGVVKTIIHGAADRAKRNVSMGAIKNFYLRQRIGNEEDVGATGGVRLPHNSSMKAVGVFPGERQVRMVDHPEPRLKEPDDVKLRMLEVGVCGTDRHVCSFEYGSAPPGSDYFVLGHEALAEVVETGPAVRGVAPGDLVVPIVRHPCGHCAPCSAGRQDFCATDDYRERGIKDMHGFMAEFVLDKPPSLHRVAKQLRDVAVLVEPLTIAEKALLGCETIQRRLPWRTRPGNAVVLGAGPVGLLGAMVLVEAGFRVWVYSRSRPPNPKADIATAIGATYVSSEDVSPSALGELAGPIELVYEAAGGVAVAFELLPLLGPNGIYIFTGVPGRDEATEIHSNRLLLHLILRNQVVMGTVNAGPDAFARAISDLEVFQRKWPHALAGLITGRFHPEQFRDPIFGSRGIKNILSFDS